MSVPQRHGITVPFEGVPLHAHKEWFEEIKANFVPDVVFTHYRDDRHQDHRVLSDLAWNTFRNHLILEYEILKYDGDIGSPNFFVHLDGEICDRKVRFLQQSFKSQLRKQWFTPDTFRALQRLRGIESNAKGEFA